jgi:zinc transport system ATP-binding protein
VSSTVVHPRAGAEAPPAPAVRLRDVCFRYPAAEVDAVCSASFDLGEREFVGVIGPNGGGKSTLLQLVLGLLVPQQGTIEVFGEPPSAARSRVGYVPQRAAIDPGVPATVLDIVLMGRLTRASWGPRFPRRDVEAARAALERARATDLDRRTWPTLSGGQRQRVLIARALVGEADLLLLDEPTAGVDTHREVELLDLLDQLNTEIPIVMVTHDLPLVAAHMDRAVWVDGTVTAMDACEVTVAGVERLMHGESGAHRHLALRGQDGGPEHAHRHDLAAQPGAAAGSAARRPSR